MIVLTTRKPEINSVEVTEGAYDGITLADFKQFIKWNADDDSEDTTMNYCLRSATKQAEMYIRRVISVASWASFLSGFVNITFDISPIDLESVGVKYYDDTNTEQELDDDLFTLTNRGKDQFASIEFESGLPETYNRNEPVWIEFDAGYEPYPEDLKAIILQEAATRFENRTNEQSGSLDQVTFGFHQRLFPWKML